ncbi:MAG: 3-oxoacyl-[acyl-carrier protein] reductase, partial [uncultured Solirubrobacteraceae bacterium]
EPGDAAAAQGAAAGGASSTSGRVRCRRHQGTDPLRRGQSRRRGDVAIVGTRGGGYGITVNVITPHPGGARPLPARAARGSTRNARCAAM